MNVQIFKQIYHQLSKFIYMFYGQYTYEYDTSTTNAPISNCTIRLNKMPRYCSIKILKSYIHVTTTMVSSIHASLS